MSHERPSLGDEQYWECWMPSPTSPSPHVVKPKMCKFGKLWATSSDLLLWWKVWGGIYNLFITEFDVQRGLFLKWDLPKFPQMSSDVLCSCSVMLEMWMCHSCARFQVLQVPEVMPENQLTHCAASQVRSGEHMGWFLLCRLLQFRPLWSQRKNRIVIFCSVVSFPPIAANNVFNHRS